MPPWKHKSVAEQYRAEGNVELAQVNEESAQYFETHLSEMLEEARTLWTREAEMVKDAIPPQDVANIAGTWLEQVYGVELGDTPLQLQFSHNEKEPLSWTVLLEKEELQQASIAINALTGSIANAVYIYPQEEQEVLAAEPLPEGAVPQKKDGLVYGYDLSGLSAEALAAYRKEAERIVALDAVSGVEGGTGWTVETEVSDMGTGVTVDYVIAHVRYANGKTARLQRLFPQGKEDYPGRLWVYMAGEGVV